MFIIRDMQVAAYNDYYVNLKKSAMRGCHIIQGKGGLASRIRRLLPPGPQLTVYPDRQFIGKSEVRMIIDEISANELERQAFRRWQARYHPRSQLGMASFREWREARQRQAERIRRAFPGGLLNPEKSKVR